MRNKSEALHSIDYLYNLAKIPELAEDNELLTVSVGQLRELVEMAGIEATDLLTDRMYRHYEK